MDTIGYRELNPQWWSPDNPPPERGDRIEREIERGEHMRELRRDAEAERWAEEQDDD